MGKMAVDRFFFKNARVLTLFDYHHTSGCAVGVALVSLGVALVSLGVVLAGRLLGLGTVIR